MTRGGGDGPGVGAALSSPPMTPCKIEGQSVRVTGNREETFDTLIMVLAAGVSLLGLAIGTSSSSVKR